MGVPRSFRTQKKRIHRTLQKFSLQKNVNAEVLAAKTNDIKHYVSAFVTGLTAIRTAVNP